MTVNPYADSWEQYIELGWTPIPLPQGKKSPPPAGVTGYDGVNPSYADHMTWLEDGVQNIANRLDPTCVGIDVDCYDGKPGAQTLSGLVDEHGELPATWMTTARDDGSGIRYFRVPEGTHLIEGLPGIEVCQYFHRYAVAPPSTNPDTGTTYRWINEATGEVDCDPPHVDDLPELPLAWLTALDRSTSRYAKAELDKRQAAEILSKFPEGKPCRHVRSGAGHAFLGAARHASYNAAVLATCGAARRGCPGAGLILRRLRSAFLAEVTPDRAGGVKEAEAEWERNLHGALAIVATDPQGDRCSDLDLWGYEPDLGSSHQGGDEEGNPGSTWSPVDIEAILDGTVEHVTADFMVREDGQHLLYSGRTHSFHGESESGKSLLAQHAAAQAISGGLRVLYIDGEDTPQGITGRLLMLGANKTSIRDNFTYVSPQDQHRGSEADREAFRELLNQKWSLVVLDGVTNLIGLYSVKTDSADDYTAWFRAVPGQFAKRTGAAVVLIDHVAKDKDNRGRHQIGTQAKLNVLTGASYVIDVEQGIGPGLRGTIIMRFGKDRPGDIRAHSGTWRKTDRTQEAARVTIDSTGLSTTVCVQSPRQVNTDSPDGSPGRFRPTTLMERVSLHLEMADGPQSTNAITSSVTGKERDLKTALDVLVEEGYVDRAQGRRGATIHRGLKPYRANLDPQSDTYVGAFQAPGGSRSVERREVGLGMTSSSSPSIGGGREEEVESQLVPLLGGSEEEVGRKWEEVGITTQSTPPSAPETPIHACAGTICQTNGCPTGENP